MEYKSFNCGSYNLHVIKTNKFKTIHLEIHFRSEVVKERLQKRRLLCDIMTNCSNKYHSFRELLIKLEDLYKPLLYGLTTKSGNVLNTMFITDFISPEYIDNPNYYSDVLSFIFDLIMNPYVVNGEFDLKNFNIVKERLKVNIEAINDHPVNKSIHEALDLAYPNTPTSYTTLGTLEELDKLNPTELYNEYKYMLEHDTCDVFIIGNVDDELTERLIKQNFSLRTIKNHDYNYYVQHDLKSKLKTKESNSNFTQSSLELIYDIKQLTPEERIAAFHVYNYILGSGGLNSKLYQEVREKNSLCYSISSIYLKYDSVLMVQVSLDNSNVNKAIKLIKKCLKEMTMGNFSDNDLRDAKQNIINSLEMSFDDSVSILNNYVFKIFDNLPDVETRINMIKKVTKDDVINVAKKLKLNTIYNLSGGKHEED